MESHSPGGKSLVQSGQIGKRNRWRRSSSTEIQPTSGRETPVSQQRNLDDQIVLEHVLGMTVYSNSALTCDPGSGLVAYPAGCVLVLLDSVKNKQLGTLHTPRKSITAVSFSSDGRYVLTGESGLQPAVRVWDIGAMTEVAMLRGHSFGIKTAVFSPRMREIIVVGDAQDMMISVWSWPGKVMGSLNKFSDEIYAMDVSANSQYFVTVGNKHVKFYYLETKRLPGGPDRTCPIPLTCRYGLLDNLKENCFCDVACGHGDNGYVFVITTSGILCQINSNRFLERWVNVNMARAFCLATDGSHVFVGGCQGLVRMFNAYNLKIVLTLPRPHCLDLDIAQVTPSAACTTRPTEGEKERVSIKRSVSEVSAVATTTTIHHANSTTTAASTTAAISSDEEDDHDRPKVKGRRHPGAKAMTFDPRHANLTVVYEDHSVYVWGRQDSRRAEGVFHFHKRYSSMYHRGCVWDLTTYPVAPPSDGDSTLISPEDVGEMGGALPPGALLSVSADSTLRAWDVSADICQESLLKRNSVSPQCLKIVYSEKSEPAAPQRKSPEGTAAAASAYVSPARRCTKLPDSLPGAASSSRHKKQGFTVVSVCPDGVHIATGNRHGRVCIYDTNTMHVLATMHAHEAEVTALGYSLTDNYKVLASGSRDRMIHVMDASRGYQLLTTLDDHSSTITAINFTYISHYMIMATSSLDMSVLVRVYMGSEAFILNPVRAIVEKKSIMDFAIHPWSGSMAFACQDRYLRVYSIMTSTDHQSFRGCPSYGGQLVKVQFDPSGQYLLTACSLKTINLLQYNTGTLLSTFNGHAESITSIRFSHNVKHVISSAVDGCIFLWRLPESITYAVKREMAEMGRLTRGMVFKRSWKKSNIEAINPKQIASEPNCVSDHGKSRIQHNGTTGDNRQSSEDLFEFQKTQLQQQQQLKEEEAGDEIKNKTKDREVQQEEEEEATLSHRLKTSSLRTGHSEWDTQASAGTCPTPAGLRRLEQTAMNFFDVPNGMRSGESQPTVRPDAWLSACCERRRIFKLEARSIKKILGMMRLVTDAMEKDLANADLLVSTAQCSPASHLLRQAPNVESISDKLRLMNDRKESPIKVGVGDAKTTRYSRAPIDGHNFVGPGGNTTSKAFPRETDAARGGMDTSQDSPVDLYPDDTTLPTSGSPPRADYQPVTSKALRAWEGYVDTDSQLLDTRSDTGPRDLAELLRNACKRACSPVPAGIDNEVFSTEGHALPVEDFSTVRTLPPQRDLGKTFEDSRNTRMRFRNVQGRGAQFSTKKNVAVRYSPRAGISRLDDYFISNVKGLGDLNFTASNGYCINRAARELWEDGPSGANISFSTIANVDRMDQNLALLSNHPTAQSSLDEQKSPEGASVNAWIDCSLLKTFGLEPTGVEADPENITNKLHSRSSDSCALGEEKDLSFTLDAQKGEILVLDKRGTDCVADERKYQATRPEFESDPSVRKGQCQCKMPEMCNVEFLTGGFEENCDPRLVIANHGNLNDENANKVSAHVEQKNKLYHSDRSAQMQNRHDTCYSSHSNVKLSHSDTAISYKHEPGINLVSSRVRISAQNTFVAHNVTGNTHKYNLAKLGRGSDDGVVRGKTFNGDAYDLENSLECTKIPTNLRVTSTFVDGLRSSGIKKSTDNWKLEKRVNEEPSQVKGKQQEHDDNDHEKKPCHSLNINTSGEEEEEDRHTHVGKCGLEVCCVSKEKRVRPDTLVLSEQKVGRSKGFCDLFRGDQFDSEGKRESTCVDREAAGQHNAMVIHEKAEEKICRNACVSEEDKPVGTSQVRQEDGDKDESSPSGKKVPRFETEGVGKQCEDVLREKEACFRDTNDQAGGKGTVLDVRQTDQGVSASANVQGRGLYKMSLPSRESVELTGGSSHSKPRPFPTESSWGEEVVDDCIRRHIKLYTADGDTTDNCDDDDDDDDDDINSDHHIVVDNDDDERLADSSINIARYRDGNDNDDNNDEDPMRVKTPNSDICQSHEKNQNNNNAIAKSHSFFPQPHRIQYTE